MCVRVIPVQWCSSRLFGACRYRRFLPCGHSLRAGDEPEVGNAPPRRTTVKSIEDGTTPIFCFVWCSYTLVTGSPAGGFLFTLQLHSQSGLANPTAARRVRVALPPSPPTTAVHSTSSAEHVSTWCVASSECTCALAVTYGTFL